MNELWHKEAPGGTVVLDQAGLALVEEHAKEGAPNTRIAAALGISRYCFADLLRRQPDAQEALAKGRSANEQELVEILMAKARKGDTVACLFLLKARHGYREGEARESDSRPNVIINLPDSISPQEYLKNIKVIPAP